MDTILTHYSYDLAVPYFNADHRRNIVYQRDLHPPQWEGWNKLSGRGACGLAYDEVYCQLWKAAQRQPPLETRRARWSVRPP